MAETSHSLRDEDPLDGLLADCLERLSQGGGDPLEELCAAHPQHAAELRRRQRGLAALGLWQGHRDATARRIGAFELVRELGRGGMGVVHLARQHGPIRRLAALKVVAGRATAHARARFDAERQVLGMLVHPNIAQVLEAGATDEGEPWYAMEFVDGRPITAYADEHRLDVEARLQLFLQLADAVQFAHQQGVLHRDLKPGNVLVCERGGRPLVKVIDFGLAKALQDPFGERADLTEQGQILGTPEYMSPEQALPTAAGIDTRTDVYALGAILYELLAGVLPFDFPALRRAGFRALQQAVCEREAPLMSARLLQLGEGRRARGLAGDLDWICGKALHKERDRRYASASELAADVRRHLRHEPVLAGPPSTVYQLKKFVRRHRAGVVFAAVLATGVVAALVVVAILLASVAEANRQQRDTLNGFTALDDADRLADLQARVDNELWRNADRLAQYGNLWPATPDRLPAFDAWLAAMRTLTGHVPDLRARLAVLRTRPTLEAYEQTLLTHLAPLLAGIEAANAPGGAASAVQQRRDWAANLRRLTIDGPEAGAKWRAAIATIADASQCPLYKGLRLEPQLGFVPLGRDDASGLYEFAFPQPGFAPPVRKDGRLVLAEDTCMVFVLIPGGMAVLGVDTDPSLPFTPSDTEYLPDQSGGPGGYSITVDLAPFLISKYEMTHAQWEAMFGAAANPSEYCQANYPKWIGSRTHPVNTIAPRLADETVRRLGLRLPTSAQWQYAARADAVDPWWTGPDPVSWYGKENLADQSQDREITQPLLFGPPDRGFDDRWPLTSPVDYGAPNPWGLFAVLGNVQESSRDPFARYAVAEPRPGDGAMVARPLQQLDPRAREVLGGSFFHAFVRARSTFRAKAVADQAGTIFGLRPSHDLEPPPR